MPGSLVRTHVRWAACPGRKTVIRNQSEPSEVTDHARANPGSMEPLDARSIPRFPHDGRYASFDSSDVSRTGGAELRSAIGRLYSAFADATLRLPLQACPHCFTPSDVVFVVETPLRSFSHGDISLIAWKLISTLGLPDDVAYFTPRIMEALAEGAFIDVNVFVKKLERMPAQAWTMERVRALSETFELLFAAADGTFDDLGSEETRERVRLLLTNPLG